MLKFTIWVQRIQDVSSVCLVFNTMNVIIDFNVWLKLTHNFIVTVWIN